MSPKPPINVNGVRFRGPRYVSCGSPYCRLCNATPASPPRFKRQYPTDFATPSQIEDDAYDRPLRPTDVAGGLLMGVILGLIVALLVLCGLAARAQTFPTTGPSTRPAPTFPKGIVSAWYYPPLENLAAVKARGCNAVVGPELGNPPRVTVKQWCEEAQRLGLGVIGDKKLLVAGYAPANLIAWICDDEPNSANHNVSPEAVATQAALFRTLRPDLPVVLTLAGDKLTSAGPRDYDLYNRYVAAVDVVWEDWYVINREVLRYWTAYLVPGKVPLNVTALAFLKERGATHLGAAVETSWQKLNSADPKGRGPTPDEYEKQVNDAVANGATWIVHFSTAPSGYPWPLAYDPTPPDVVARITAVNARLNPPAVVPPLPDVLTAKVDALEQRAARAEAAAARTDAALNDLAARLLQALQPATRPAGAGN